MDDADIYARLGEIFRQQFRDPDLVIAASTGPDDVPGWDSTAHVGIIMAVEDDFGVEFGPQDLRQFRDVGSIAGLLRRRCG